MMRFLRIGVLAVMAAGAGWSAYSRGGFPAWFLYNVLCGMLVYALAVHLFSLLRVKIERQTPRPVLSFNETMTAVLDIRLFSLVPAAWLTVTDRWVREQNGEMFAFRGLFFPGLRRTIHFSYGVRFLPRGTYRFVETELAAGDLLGLVRKRRIVKASGCFTILPESPPFSAELMPRGSGEEELGSAAVFFRDIHGFGATARPYAPGDPLHRIHWKSTAKRGELMTRDPEPREDLKVWIALEGAESAYDGHGGLLRFEKAVEWAAGMLREACGQGISAGFYTAAGGGVRRFPVGRNGGEEAIRILAELKPGKGWTLGETLLNEAGSGIPEGHVLVCITPTLSEKLEEALLSVRSQGKQVLLFHIHERPSLAERERGRRLERSGCMVRAVTEPYREKGVRTYAG